MAQENLLEIAKSVAKLAGIEVMKHYHSGDFTKTVKDDDSPVTSADLAANDVIMTELTRLTPDIPIISEEVGAEALNERRNWQRYWLLDPIDGTGEFILKSGDFAVNIALVENGWPTIGVIHAPDHNLTYFAQAGLGAFKEADGKAEAISVATYDENRAIKVAVSRRQKLHVMGKYLSDNYQYEYVPLGSASLKNCLIAEGLADCYLRVGPTGEWDTGASQCILEQAGGKIIDSEFLPLSYNARETLMNPDFMSLGNQAFPWQKIVKPHRASRTL